MSLSSIESDSYTSVAAVLSVATALSMGTTISLGSFFPYLSPVECIAAGPPLGLTLSVWISLFFKSFVFGSSDGLPASMALCGAVVQALVTLVFWRRIAASWDTRRSDFFKSSFYALRLPFLLVGALATWFGYIHYTHSLGQWQDKYYVGGSVYGDMPFHLNIITSWLWGANSHARPLIEPMKATFYADHPLVYPYIPDYHAACLVGAGSSFHFAFFIPGAILTASFLVLLFCLSLRLSGSVMTATLAVPSAVFAGGIGAFIWLFNDGTYAAMRTKDHVLYVIGSNEPELGWFSLTAHILLPQRTTQFAYPISLLALILVLRAIKPQQEAAPADMLPSPPPKDRTGGATRPGYTTPDRKKRHQEDVPTPGMLAASPPRDSAQRLPSGQASTPLDVSWLFVGPAARTRLLIHGGLVTGLLPLLQAHSFVAVGLVILVVALLEVLSLAKNAVFKPSKPGTPTSGAFSEARSPQMKGKPAAPAGSSLLSAIKSWIIYGVAAFAIGLPQSTIYFGKAAGGTKVQHPDGRITPFIRLVPLWHDQHEPTAFHLWWEALAFFVPLNILGLFVLPLTPVQRRFQIGFLSVFVMANYVIFQPWELDNTKVFYIWVFGAASLVGGMVRRIWKAASYFQAKHNLAVVGLLAKCVAVCTMFSLVFSGFLCMVNETMIFDPMFDAFDMENAMWLRENTPIDARLSISTHGTHFRPESALGGRTVMTSYVGWVSNHGMPGWIKRNEDLNFLQEGRDTFRAWDTLLKYNITHFTLDWYEVNRWNVDFANAYGFRAASNGRFVIYQVVPPQFLANPEECPLGDLTPTEANCLSKGCIWVHGYHGPWCQVPPTVSAYKEMAGEDYQPADCGHHGMDQAACKRQGCSWFPNFAGPWCQQPVGVPSSSVWHGRGGMRDMTVGDSPDCGWYGVDEVMCQDRGCFWKPVANEPWCKKPGH